jgi:hypothetical protein
MTKNIKSVGPEKPRGTAPSTVSAKYRGPALVLLIVVVLAVVSIWLWRSSSRPAPAQSIQLPGTNSPVLTAEAKPELQKLKGRWLRPDGGYILEIKTIDSSGTMEAQYFNPRSINVSKAVALREGNSTKLFVELRDVNYPGSTYTLVHDAKNDRLVGVYYQAAQQQSFEVEFVRENGGG